jgi:hypothetical protein
MIQRRQGADSVVQGYPAEIHIRKPHVYVTRQTCEEKNKSGDDAEIATTEDLVESLGCSHVGDRGGGGVSKVVTEEKKSLDDDDDESLQKCRRPYGYRARATKQRHSKVAPAP